MRSVTVRNLSRCAGTGHIFGDLYVNGEYRRAIACETSQVLTAFTELDPEQMFALFCRVAVASSGATTLAQAKAAVEAQEWRL